MTSSVFLKASESFRLFTSTAGLGVLFRTLRCHLCYKYLDPNLFDTNYEEEHDDLGNYLTYD